MLASKFRKVYLNLFHFIYRNTELTLFVISFNEKYLIGILSANPHSTSSHKSWPSTNKKSLLAYSLKNERDNGFTLPGHTNRVNPGHKYYSHHMS